jgi:polyhydroxybutyrate depolymerase
MLRIFADHGFADHGTVASIVALLSLGALAGCGSKSGASSATGDGGGSSDAGACGTMAGMRGKTFRTVMAGGQMRTYVAYLPTSLDGSKPAPLLYVFHGALMNGEDMYDITGFSGIADSEGVAVAFPDGQGVNSQTSATALDPWNVSDNGAAVCGYGDLANNSTSGVDFDMMDAIKADLAQFQCLDASHVFVAGFSMGGYFTHHVGCDRTDVKAIAPHSGGTIASLSSCATGNVPVIIFHGLSDDVINVGCDDPHSPMYESFTASATLWAQKNGCQTTSTTITDDSDAGGDGQCYLYDGCPSDGQVELCTFTGMNHCWAGGATDAGGSQFSCPTYASATQLAWSFWKKYAW